jgi:hypothetical protein
LASSPETPLLTFQPAELRRRYDGWTADKQYRFIQALAETACVEEACKRVGMTRQSAYRLRQRPCGLAFRRGWDAALDCGMHRLEQAALGRALNGVPRPVFYKGEQVGEWRDYDERLTMFLLKHRRSERFGKWIERMLAPDPEEFEDDGIRLDGPLTDIEFGAPEHDGNPDDNDPE